MTKLRFHCRYCPAVLSDFKQLIEHYHEFHDPHLRWYQVVNKSGKGQGITQATLEEEACRFFGWDRIECEVSEVKDK